MKFELTVTEFKEMFNSLQSPHELLELLRVDFSNQVGIYLYQVGTRTHCAPALCGVQGNQ